LENSHKNSGVPSGAPESVYTNLFFYLYIIPGKPQQQFQNLFLVVISGTDGYFVAGIEALFAIVISSRT